MIIGYARVSTVDQNLELQVAAIEKYAAEKGKEFEIFFEKESAARERKELKQALRMARKGDEFIVYKLDRLARSTKQLIEITEELKEKEVDFVSLQDNIDTTTSTGKAMFGMLAVFAEFERDILIERTRAGLDAARRRGRRGGRPNIPEDTKRMVRSLFVSGDSAADIAKEFGIGRSTVYKIINEERDKND